MIILKQLFFCWKESKFKILVFCWGFSGIPMFTKVLKIDSALSEFSSVLWN